MSVKRLQEIAQACHEANRAYCQLLGDTSQPPWEDAPEWQKNSAIDGVSLFIANPDVTPRESHENWMQLKLNEGWCWGPEKNTEDKTHPALVPFETLPSDVRFKDYLFLITCRMFVKVYG